MNEQEVIQQFLSDLNAALPADVGARTDGGDENSKPPYVIVRWRSSRLQDENGANPFADFIRDSDGTATGREFHQYNEFVADCVVRSYEESERDSLLGAIDDAFLPYEYDSDLFHADTAEWRVGGAEPRSNPVVEPDWYEGGKVIRFKYLKRVTRDADSLGTAQQNIDAE
ncbi:hypothetical protein HTZ84_09520 [Haloterrigena sp. SYSU A558-1]|uniref:Uncharacterized protein n=1 Tax=Haloterrigena gelatinilytica TaxID=2741724 RepID=A0ABX2LBJ9_9EURY|nr:hypothetical protein [Haloterrigena gelatinilytica]NUC72544.1 hypothetical protein [Haloterrigena gelatinilytica]